MPVQAKTPTIEDLLKKLEERDAIIEDLMCRVDELEHRVASPGRSPSAVDGHMESAVSVAVRPVPKPSLPR
jgi:HEPN domain-containing protein